MAQPKKCSQCGQTSGRGRPIMSGRFDRDFAQNLRQIARNNGTTLAALIEQAVVAAYPKPHSHDVDANPLLQPVTAPLRTNTKTDMNLLRSAGSNLTVPMNGDAKPSGTF